jgi:hypothetical protein
VSLNIRREKKHAVSKNMHEKVLQESIKRRFESPYYKRNFQPQQKIAILFEKSVEITMFHYDPN